MSGPKTKGDSQAELFLDNVALRKENERLKKDYDDLQRRYDELLDKSCRMAGKIDEMVPGIEVLGLVRSMNNALVDDLSSLLPAIPLKKMSFAQQKAWATLALARTQASEIKSKLKT